MWLEQRQLRLRRGAKAELRLDVIELELLVAVRGL
jgi:hypothetical protein